MNDEYLLGRWIIRDRIIGSGIVELISLKRMVEIVYYDDLNDIIMKLNTHISKETPQNQNFNILYGNLNNIEDIIEIRIDSTDPTTMKNIIIPCFDITETTDQTHIYREMSVDPTNPFTIFIEIKLYKTMGAVQIW